MSETRGRESRLDAVRHLDPDAAALVERLLSLAPRGLSAARLADGSYAQTLRGHRDEGTTRLTVRLEGRNPRYAAMAGLGLARLTGDAPQHDPGGDALGQTLRRALADADEPGAHALAAWAEAEAGGRPAERLLTSLHALLTSGEPVPTVAAAWAVTAGVAARHLGDTTDLVADGCARLLAHSGDHGVYPHVLGDRTGLRGHVGSFADQIYPVQALARAAAATKDPTLLAAADRTAAVLCHHQGADGQWAWHYDTRTGDLVERYPVYSVHQHAMAPMVFFDLADAGGTAHVDRVARGVRWLLTHPEVEDDLIDDDIGVVWRKVGRRERAKASRVAAGLTTAIRPGWHLPGVDRLLPPTRIDHECRPYELGWLLYAWLPAGCDATVSALATTDRVVAR